VSPDGALAEIRGMWVVDVHHRLTVTKNEDGLHVISLGFTSLTTRCASTSGTAWWWMRGEKYSDMIGNSV